MKETTLSLVLVVAAGLGPAGCRSPGTQEPSPAAAPAEKVPGLHVEGPRSKANVIAVMAPVAKMMQEIYAKHRAENPDLKGIIDLRFTVEWTGEIGPMAIERTDIEDEKFLQQVLRPMEFLDFDGWAVDEEDTEVVYPLRFGV